MINYHEHILREDEEARTALRILDKLSTSISRTLFIVDANSKMVGSLSDGDIRRGLLNGLEISVPVSSFMNHSFRSILESEDNVEVLKAHRLEDIKLIPLLNNEGLIVQILDLRKTRTLLPVTALIMAGGKGERLRPYTDHIPKPMLKIGDKPIIEHTVDRLISFGICEIFISVKYLKEQIIDFLGDGSAKGIRIHYIEETEPLGTLGALALMPDIFHEDILVMNSDLLTNIDLEEFFQVYKSESACMAVASIPYQVNVPYAVLETKQNQVLSFIEKPSYTYYSNGGIYFMKTLLKEDLSKGDFYNATDMMDRIISDERKKLVHYPVLGYWLDIGRHQDFVKAQEDIKHLSLY
jgi:dTDP-glucose pyrophosphorylase